MMKCESFNEAIIIAIERDSKAVLQDGDRFLALLGDIAPKFTAEREILRLAFRHGYVKELQDALKAAAKRLQNPLTRDDLKRLARDGKTEADVLALFVFSQIENDIGESNFTLTRRHIEQLAGEIDMKKADVSFLLDPKRFTDPETQSAKWMPKLFRAIVLRVRDKSGMAEETVIDALGSYAMALGYKLL